MASPRRLAANENNISVRKKREKADEVTPPPPLSDRRLLCMRRILVVYITRPIGSLPTEYVWDQCMCIVYGIVITNRPQQTTAMKRAYSRTGMSMLHACRTPLPPAAPPTFARRKKIATPQHPSASLTISPQHTSACLSFPDCFVRPMLSNTFGHKQNKRFCCIVYVKGDYI